MELNNQEEVEFRVNKGYADNYNRWRRKEELQKYKDKYGADIDEEDSSSSETEDEDAEGLTPQIERDFFRTLSIVKSKDPKMYQTDVHFYEEEESDESGEHPQEGSRQKQAQRSKGDKPMYLKDYERKIIVEKEGQYTDDKGDEDDDDEEEDQEEILRAASPTYIQEQRQIRESFYSAVHDVSDDDDVLKVKQKSKEEKEEEEKDYIKWLKGEKSEPVTDETGTSEMNALRKFWNDPKLDEGERFLRDFILNKGYIDKDPSGLSGFHLDDDDDDDDDDEDDDEDGDGDDKDANQEDFSEEERILEEQEEFERKYNFRFEEPDSDFIKRYPRTVADTVRRKDVRRSDKRKEKRSRKEEEKAKKQEELKHLKNLKKQEIVERLDKLKEVTGNEAVGFDLDDLEGDFDPEEHDRLMQKVFNDQYDEQEEDVKPTFDEEDEPGEENWDEWNRKDYESGNYGDGGYYEGYDEEFEETEGLHCEDADFVMDADYEEQSAAERRELSQKELAQEMMGASRKKRKKMSRFARSLLKKKPVFNPEDKSFEDYIDEYYRLDYEDTIGDLACRFKYRTVQANDFGLSTEEILKAREKELNQWASLKKTCQYRTEEEEKKDVALFRKMRENAGKKKRIFLSFQESDEEETTADDVQPETQTSASADSEEQSRKRKRSRKRQKGEPNTTAKDDTGVASKPPSGGKENGTTADKPRTSERVEEEEEKGGTENAKRGKSLVESDTRTAQKVGGADAIQGNEPQRNVRIAVGDSPVAPGAAAAAAGTLSSREKKKQRKREILAKLKAMRRAKGPKRLQGARPRVRMGDRNMSEARFRAYGLNPKKHRYRLAHEKAASGN
ncbi:protein KRI1 homolog [Diadema antillarum]|uniref:protein KRI1 homolog n=1 Tax=Diadema antillarum TaxID=105358 RepID=UPI003A859BBA